MNNNIPAGYDENGVRCGTGTMDNDIEEAQEKTTFSKSTPKELKDVKILTLEDIKELYKELYKS